MPDWDNAIRARLKALNLDGEREAEVVEELAEHLDECYRELIASGLDHEQAIRSALEELDSQDLLSTSVRRKRAPAAIGAKGGHNIVESIWHDLKVAARMIRMKPAFSAAVIGMLALGVAGNAAIFSIFNGLFLRPLPFAEPERLVDLDEAAPKWNLTHTGVANIDYATWQKENTTFDGMAFFGGGGANLTTASGGAQRVRTSRVTHSLLDVYGLKPVAGRNFVAEEDRPGGARVVLLGYDLWQRLFNGDRNAIGQSVKFDDVPYTIIGILPREAVLPDTEAWTLLQADLAQGSGWYLSGVGRLKHGVTIQQATDDLTRVHRGMIETGRKVNEITSPVMERLRDRYLGQMRPVTHILLGAVTVVLLIACVNIAGLMLVRGEARSREIAIRTAVGASRGRVIRQLLTESVVLAAAGGVLGVALGKVFLNGLVSMMSDNIPRWVRFDLDGRFALFCIAATGAAAILFGLAPALHAATADSRGCLQATTRSTLSRGKRGVLSVLVVGEIALALMLLISSGLLLQAFRKVLNTNSGFRPQGVMTFSLRLPNSKYEKPEQRHSFYTNLVDRLKNMPGVTTASAATIIPLNGHQGNFFEVEGGRQLGPNEQNPVTLTIRAMPGYFEAMGMTFLGGHGFKVQDVQTGAPPVAVVNESFAKYFWGTSDVTGKRLRFPNPKNPWMQVVGVIRDTRHYGIDGIVRPGVFLPAYDPSGMTIVMRGAMDANALVTPTRDILRQLDADLPMYDIRSMTERVERSLWVRRAYSWLFAAFAAVAMLLAAAGIYGVISFAVSQRTREIGIRIALGARPGQVMSGVLRSGMLLITIGVTLGLAASRLTARFLETLLFGVSNRDVVTYIVVITGVAAIGLLANYVPARRASRVDPMGALRAE